MNVCGRIRAQDLHLYLDNELAPAAAIELEKHLIECAGCRAAFEELRAVVDVVRGAQPLYETPAGALACARRVAARRPAQMYRLTAAAALAAAAVLCGLWLSGPSGEFRAFAADSHLRYARGAMPLDIASSQPEEISGWLGARVPFHLQLPDYAAGQVKRYRLKGARLLQYRNRDIAFLAYEMDRKPISLLMTSDPVAAPSGGAVYRSGALAFHFSESKGLKLISWTDRGVHYSLASELGARGAESCIICHGKAGERRVIDDLKPR